MFDIGFSELLLIAVVALVVLGPERLPKAARFAGLWVRKARAQWHSVKSELEREIADEELKRTLHDSRDAMRSLDDSMRTAGDEARREFDAMRSATLAMPGDTAVDGETTGDDDARLEAPGDAGDIDGPPGEPADLPADLFDPPPGKSHGGPTAMTPTDARDDDDARR
jgi:sec-independent protein translocase protein TatB